MELMPALTQQTASYCQNGRGAYCPSLNLTVTAFQQTVQKLKGLSNLPDLEITPVTKAANKSVTESNERSSSVEAGISKEGNPKERNDMDNLLKRLPILNQFFHLHSKIGEGTFSTVYLATLKNSNSNKSYAVKHLTQICQQMRIDREFKCMKEIGGRDNVVHVEYCLTSGDDCVTFVMPYLPHKKFSDYVLDMDAEETRLYMKNLFIALKRVHSFNIIHRDVKPGNFLYNRETKQFLLVDFGLAQAVQNHEGENNKESIPADENMPIDYSKKRKRKESVSDKEKTTPVKRTKKTKERNVRLYQLPDGCSNGHLNGEAVQSGKIDIKSPINQYQSKGSAEKTPLKTRDLNMVNCASDRRKKLFEGSSPEGRNAVGKVVKGRHVTGNAEERVLSVCNVPVGRDFKREKSFTPLVSSKSPTESFIQVRNSRVVRQCEVIKPKGMEIFHKPQPITQSISEVCSCNGRGAICAMCSSRSKMIAPRAGTPGFRPPEVLLRYVHQTTAVDMWASGVILLCILSGCYPFFKSPNDLVALAEIMTVFGTESVTEIAAKFGRKVVSSNKRKAVDLKKMCKVLRARSSKKSNLEKNANDVKCKECCQTIRKDGCLCILENSAEEGASGDDVKGEFPDSAFHLLKRLLDLDPTTRITAAEALEHPFILGL